MSPFNSVKKFFKKYKSGAYLKLDIYFNFPHKARLLSVILLTVKMEHNYEELMQKQGFGFYTSFQLTIFKNYTEKLIFVHCLLLEQICIYHCH